MQKFYLVPIEQVGGARGPKYFSWRFDPDPPGIDCRWSMMPYGFFSYALVLAHDITQTDHVALILHTDVYNFPDDLDTAVSDPNIDVFFEGINIPTDWLTPSTTYRELLRQLAGMFQFNQRYRGISEGHDLFETATLDTRLRNLSSQEKIWFDATVVSFGYDPNLINDNSFLRQLIKQAGNFWSGQPFTMGGVVF